MTPTGFEPNSLKAWEGSGCNDPAQRGVAELYANQPDSTLIDPDLATVVQAWPRLPDEARRRVLAIVEAAGHGGEG